MAYVAGYEGAYRVRVGISPNRRLEVGCVEIPDRYAPRVTPTDIASYDREADGLFERNIVVIGTQTISDVVVREIACEPRAINGLKPNAVSCVAAGLTTVNKVFRQYRVRSKNRQPVAERGAACVLEAA
jgi:hypothetical protein